MYPLVLLLLLVAVKKDKKIADYVMGLSLIGAVIAGYHYLMQVGVVKGGSCAAVGYSVACAQRFVLRFSYVSIPMMALSAFLLILVTMAIVKRKKS